jgi:hypothetical protein
MISTRHLDALPNVRSLRRLTRSLAMLDAILSPDWESRYFSFDSRWGDGELVASMRNGQGDHWFAWFGDPGAVLIGLDHEAPMYRFGNPWPGVLDAVPKSLADVVREPAFESQHSTFCIWHRADGAGWERGPVQYAPGDDPDGSAALLQILDGRPESYRTFTAEYYERDIPTDAIAAIYGHAPLTKALVDRLDPDVSVADLEPDRTEIGYPELD